MKTCTSCDATKPPDEFHRDKTQKDGHAYACKECKRKATLAWNARKRAEIGEEAWLARVRKNRAEYVGRVGKEEMRAYYRRRYEAARSA